MGVDPATVAPVAVATRNGLDESLHHGAGVALAADGTVAACVGEPDTVIYPRSSLKPLQAEAMVEMGLELPGELMALVCASHDGAPMHLDGVRRLLAMFDHSEADLRNTPALPYGGAARADARRAGVEPSALQQNCSGKHAAMLATCRINGWPIDGYTAADHPLQQGITAALVRFGCHVHHVGIDGCGAPTHALSLHDLAASFATLVASGSTVAPSMRAFPEWVGGSERDVTVWMRAVPGLVAKDGAAGVMALAMTDGRAAAFKIADGSGAARQAVTVEALRSLGLDVDGEFAEATAAVAVPTLGHGLPVGALRALNWTPCSS